VGDEGGCYAALLNRKRVNDAGSPPLKEIRLIWWTATLLLIRKRTIRA